MSILATSRLHSTRWAEAYRWQKAVAELSTDLRVLVRLHGTQLNGGMLLLLASIVIYGILEMYTDSDALCVPKTRTEICMLSCIRCERIAFSARCLATLCLSALRFYGEMHARRCWNFKILTFTRDLQT